MAYNYQWRRRPRLGWGRDLKRSNGNRARSAGLEACYDWLEGEPQRLPRWPIGGAITRAGATVDRSSRTCRAGVLLMLLVASRR